MRLKWIVVAVVGGLLSTPASAAATEFGGGSLSLTGAFDPALSLVALRTDGSALKARAEATPRCGKGVIDHAAVVVATTIKSDGTFSRSATARESSARSVHLDISGSVAGNSASGQLTLTTSTKIGRKTRSCSTGSIPWQARAVIAQPTGTGQPQASVRYYGTTSQINASVPSGFVMGVTADAGSVIQAVFAWRARCSKGSSTNTERAPSMKTQDGALGTARVRSTRRNKRTGKLLSTCDSKTFSWSAIL
jgi:hypothetical protein